MAPPRTAPALPPAVPGELVFVDDPRTGKVAFYAAGPASGEAAPALLVHSVNAAASAYEVRPVFEHLAATRPTYALDLPGFGHSDRSDRAYSPRLMTDAVLVALDEVRRRHPGATVDVLGLSLGCEFVARAASEVPEVFRSVALVSPTGLDGRGRRVGAPGTTRAVPGLHAVLSFSLWDDALFGALTRPGTIRYFLERTWGGKDIDEGLWAYDVLTTQQPGAKHAPLRFVSAQLFSADATRLYESLAMPVWVAHGVRGDFTDYRGVPAMSERGNWRVRVFETGALPFFEMREPFLTAYDAFLGLS